LPTTAEKSAKPFSPTRPLGGPLASLRHIHFRPFFHFLNRGDCRRPHIFGGPPPKNVASLSFFSSRDFVKKPAPFFSAPLSPFQNSFCPPLPISFPWSTLGFLDRRPPYAPFLSLAPAYFSFSRIRLKISNVVRISSLHPPWVAIFFFGASFYLYPSLCFFFWESAFL